MKKCDCLLCSFENPKPTATAIVIKDQKLLVAKRSQAPFAGKWDFIGGYLQKNETAEEALQREIKEELGVNSSFHFIGAFSGSASYKEYLFPVLNFAYLAQLHGEIRLNKKENLGLAWVPIKSLKSIAFDSNQKILKFLKKRYIYDLARVKKLIFQLDPSAVFAEDSLYRAMLSGYVAKIEKKGKLIGLGWIFPRQTLLRHQAVIENMIVDQNYRGRGLGEKILNDLLVWARIHGVEMVELTTNPGRTAANALYQKAGFKLHKTNHYLLKLR